MTSSSADLSFKDDPGAVRHGNFINYYQFHGAQQRINAFPDDINLHIEAILGGPNETIYALDLGCNSGEITQGLVKFLNKKGDRKLRILGVDIDPQLIQRAVEANEHSSIVQYLSGDLMKILSQPDQLLSFTNRKNFHLITCLSITMWIHLNNGDDGLREFLKNSAQISEVLVVEPQRWKSYKDAVRRMKRGAGITDAFPHFPNLKWRETVEEDIHQYLESNACQMKLIFKSDPSSWSRKISVYVKVRGINN